MGNLSAVRIDTKKEVDGVEFDYFEDIKLKVARFDNPAFTKFMRASLKPHQQALRDDQLSEAVAERIYHEGLAKHVLVGWSGITDSEGNAVPYTPEKALEYLSDPAYRDFKRAVETFAKRTEAFRVETLKALAGN